ncbi:serum amyloid P-component-like [Alosa sapidissima]|uniref:serum amyloid P-component-like n=1 Tax=Alosa sapidissima TaxID=34773 RepID=UPI001C091BE4|nr:serum amyloid P-component-like [Alosa sapidissima]
MESTILKNITTLLLVYFTQSYAERKDLSGKMFTFPVESDTAHVILDPNESNSLTAVTTCLRFFSDLTRAQSLFSFATPASPNSFLFYKQVNHVYEINEYDNVVLFRGLEDIANRWNSVCATWNSQTGIAQLWVNGKPSTRKGVRRGREISGTPSIILGQDQDSYGGKFDKAQSFVGMLTDVHMWDKVLPYPEIALYMNGIPQKTGGNVINWSSLDFTIKEYVLVEDFVNGLNG